MPDAQSSMVLLIIFAVLGVIVLTADGVIFVRWVAYLWAKYDYEERLRLQAESEPVQQISELDSVAASIDSTYRSAGSADQQDREASPISPRAPEPEAPRYPFARTWSLVDPFIGFQAVFIIGNIIATIPLMFLMFPHGHFIGTEAIFSAPGILVQTLGLFLVNGLFVGMTAFYVHRYRSSLAKIGMGRPTARQIAIGFGIGLVLFAVANGAEAAVGGVLTHLLPRSVAEGIRKLNDAITAGGMFTRIPTLQLKIFFALAGAVAAPIGEEVFFRGLLYNSLKRRLNVPAAIVISGLLFALVHFGPIAMLIIFPMGVALAYVYEKTQSLWVTICMHATNNALAFILTLAFSHAGEETKPASPVPPPTKPGHTRQLSPPARPNPGSKPHG